MKFAEDHNAAKYKITGYDKNSISINGKSIEKSAFILSPMELKLEWKPEAFGQLANSHLDEIYTLNPEVIILGTGLVQIFPEKEILKRLAQGKVGYEIMGTQAACRTFNILMAEGRNVVAALFLK